MELRNLLIDVQKKEDTHNKSSDNRPRASSKSAPCQSHHHSHAYREKWEYVDISAEPSWRTIPDKSRDHAVRQKVNRHTEDWQQYSMPFCNPDQTCNPEQQPSRRKQCTASREPLQAPNWDSP